MDSTKLLKVIKKIVKEEVRKQVKSVINEVLAERFISSVSSGNLSQVIAEGKKESPSSAPRAAESRESIVQKEQMRKKFLEKVTDNDPMLNMIYEDVDPTQMNSAPNGHQILPDGAYVDSDDEGVDPTIFMRR